MTQSIKNYAEILEKVKGTDIDKEGRTFKYILIRVEPKNVNQKSDSYVSKTLVRGYENCYYHGDILDEVETKEKLGSKGLAMDCLGGGRIRHEKNKLHVYGYSQGFGKGDHNLARSLLLKDFPDYEITTSDEGY